MKKIIPPFISELKSNLRSFPQFIQVILGPRQVGKTTGVLQLKETFADMSYCTADEELSVDHLWIERKWQDAVFKNPNGILIIDEIQKIPDWSPVVKKLWDNQKKDKKSNLKLILLGSSSLEIQTGLTESLTGRFQLIRATHWGFSLSNELQDMDVKSFVTYGGYPGSYSLLKNKKKWEVYIRDSIIETVIGKDILNLARVNKPALFRQAFGILMSYPAQDISYTKLLGQLQDKGNTELVKHYIELYEGAYLIKSLQKYSTKSILKRASSPKLIPLCGALINRDVFLTSDGYGRAVEAAVGACLINNGFDVYYWREGDKEVDYVVEYEGRVYALEVKSGRSRSSKGMAIFLGSFKNAKPLFVHEENIRQFLLDPFRFFKI